MPAFALESGSDMLPVHAAVIPREERYPSGFVGNE